MANTQYTQGSLVTITVTTMDQNGNPVPPDNSINPTCDLDFMSPGGSINIFTGRVTTGINPSFYYINIDSTLLAIGSYLATLKWTVGGLAMSAQVRFDILQFDGSTLLPLDPISRLRLRLKDNDPDPTRWIWSDLELSEYLNDALEAHNAAPPRTSFFWFNVPLQYMNNILQYAEYLALKAQSTKIASQAVQYSDRNLTINKPAQAQLYANLADRIFEVADKERLRIKRQYAYGTGYITTPNMPYMSTPPLRAYGRFWNM